MHIVDRMKSIEQIGKEWKNIIPIISAGSLAILAGMIPESKPEYPENYWLAASWILLCLSIPITLFSSHFYSITSEKFMFYASMDLGRGAAEQKTIPASEETKKFHRLNKIAIAILTASLLLFYSAFVSLTIYACLRIF